VDTLTLAQLAQMMHTLMTQQGYARTGIKWRCEVDLYMHMLLQHYRPL
jgi:hypothetical protein